jgi:hypothetical protein
MRLTVRNINNVINENVLSNVFAIAKLKIELKKSNLQNSFDKTVTYFILYLATTRFKCTTKYFKFIMYTLVSMQTHKMQFKNLFCVLHLSIRTIRSRACYKNI